MHSWMGVVMTLGSQVSLSMSDFLSVSSTRHRRNPNALHSWVPGSTFSQRDYTGVTSPLRMYVQMHPIQRNARCMLPCVRDLILAAYLSTGRKVSCWSHGFLRVQCISTLKLKNKHHIRYFERFLISQFNDRSGRVELIGTID